MAKQFLVCIVVVVLGLVAPTCRASLYTVGDSSGWDISTDIDTWTKGKSFVVGDVLLFQYSSYHSVSEVTEPSYEGCNTTDVLQTSSNGNTTYPLTAPGDRYFVCGNKLHCLGGMKLHVAVQGNQVAAPAGAPEPVASLPTPTSKSNTPSAVVPSSAESVHGGVESLVLVFIGLVATMFWVV